MQPVPTAPTAAEDGGLSTHVLHMTRLHAKRPLLVELRVINGPFEGGCRLQSGAGAWLACNTSPHSREARGERARHPHDRGPRALGPLLVVRRRATTVLLGWWFHSNVRCRFFSTSDADDTFDTERSLSSPTPTVVVATVDATVVCVSH